MEPTPKGLIPAFPMQSAFGLSVYVAASPTYSPNAKSATLSRSCRLLQVSQEDFGSSSWQSSVINVQVYESPSSSFIRASALVGLT